MSQPQRVRFGGVRVGDRYLFELTGGHPCLDFANTLDERRTGEPRELLVEYKDLLDWGIQTGVINAGLATALGGHAARHPGAARTALARARNLREAIFDVFASFTDSRATPSRALALLNDAIAQAGARRLLEPSNGGFAWRWNFDATDLERVVLPVAWSAGELLTSDRLDRVRVCSGAGCAWLFLDTSRNRTRRWCDMTVCGNREKARRHYAKTSGGQDQSGSVVPSPRSFARR